MLKVKKTTYGEIPKTNELTKITSEIKQATKKQMKKKTKKPETINDYAKLIQSIKKEYQKLALENEILKKKLKTLEDKQLTTDLINHHRKQQEFFEGGKRKRHYKKQTTYSESSSGTESEYYIPKKKKTRKKTTTKYKRYYDNDDQNDFNDDIDG